MCQVKRSPIPSLLVGKKIEGNDTMYSATPKKNPMKRFKNRHAFLRIDTAVQSVLTSTDSFGRYKDRSSKPRPWSIRIKSRNFKKTGHYIARYKDRSIQSEDRTVWEDRPIDPFAHFHCPSLGVSLVWLPPSVSHKVKYE
jgi:hypothetical protein